MAFQLVYTKRAVEDIRELDQLAQKRLAKKLEHFAQNPLSFSKKIHDSALGTYRFRVGDYRIVFDLEGKKVIILRVGHRREIYR